MDMNLSKLQEVLEDRGVWHEVHEVAKSLNSVTEQQQILSHSIFEWFVYMFSRVQLCDPMDCSPPGSSVYDILQARILEWVAISFSRGLSQPRD